MSVFPSLLLLHFSVETLLLQRVWAILLLLLGVISGSFRLSGIALGEPSPVLYPTNSLRTIGVTGIGRIAANPFYPTFYPTNAKNPLIIAGTVWESDSSDTSGFGQFWDSEEPSETALKRRGRISYWNSEAPYGNGYDRFF